MALRLAGKEYCKRLKLGEESLLLLVVFWDLKGMEQHRRHPCCFTEIDQLRRDLDWNFRALCHVNRKHEHVRRRWDNWTSREEEGRVQEWHAQTQLNNALIMELVDLKEHM